MKDRSRPASEIGGEIDWGERLLKTGKTAISTPEKLTVANSPIKEVKVPSIAFGEVAFLLGDNGTGKTKLMEAMKGSREIPRERGINIAYMPQFWPKEIAEGTVEDFYHWIKKETDPVGAVKETIMEQGIGRNRFIKELGRFKSKGEARALLNKPLASFSGGEQRLLWLLAVAAQQAADAFLLDEPTNHMDRGLRSVVTKAIRDFKGAVVIATHDIDLIDALTEDSGRKPIKPRNFIMTKEKGQTAVKEVKEVSKYISEAMEKATKAAKRIKI